MKKIGILFLAVLLVCSFVSCSGAGPEDLVGVWKTENVGYYTVTTFLEDGSFNSVYTVSDPEAVEAYGITQEVLDSMSSESFYSFVSQNDLTPEEKEQSGGRYAIKVFATREDMESGMNGSMSYYTIDDDTLTLDGCVYTRFED